MEDVNYFGVPGVRVFLAVRIGLSGGKNRIHGHIAELCIICQDAKVKLGTVIFNITDK